MASTAKSVKKIMEESRSRGYEEIDLQDRAITNITDVPFLCKYQGRKFYIKALTMLVLGYAFVNIMQIGAACLSEVYAWTVVKLNC